MGILITWDSRLGCPRAGILPALQKIGCYKILIPYSYWASTLVHCFAKATLQLLQLLHFSPGALLREDLGRARVLWILYQVQLETCRFP